MDWLFLVPACYGDIVLVFYIFASKGFWVDVWVKGFYFYGAILFIGEIESFGEGLFFHGMLFCELFWNRNIHSFKIFT